MWISGCTRRQLELRQAPGFLNIPQSNRPVLAGTQKGVFGGRYGDSRHFIGMTSKFAEQLIVVNTQIMNGVSLSHGLLSGSLSRKQNTHFMVTVSMERVSQTIKTYIQSQQNIHSFDSLRGLDQMDAFSFTLDGLLFGFSIQTIDDGQTSIGFGGDKQEFPFFVIGHADSRGSSRDDSPYPW
jgi:hypothetical protein